MRFDLFNKPLNTEDIITGLEAPSSMCFYNNDLYVAEYNANTIIKINPHVEDPKKQIVTNNINSPSDIIIYNDELYIVEFFSNKILFRNM